MCICNQAQLKIAYDLGNTDHRKKITEECKKLADLLSTPSHATGDAIVTFKTESARNQFVSRVQVP